MSPRRSSRARINPPPPPSVPKHTNSSTSSISSGRAERSTRSHDKNGSPRHSNPRSQSLEDSTVGANDPPKPPPRRTRSGHEEIKEPPLAVKDEEEDEDIDEEEVTRCVCGQTEYPGPPVPLTERLKQQAKDIGVSTPSTVPHEEGGNMFIQCDICKVWQHGGCVGVLDDASAPDEYFCEECRRDLHKVGTALTGYVVLHPIHTLPAG